MEGEGLPVLSFKILSGNIYDPATRDRNTASEGEMRKSNEQEDKIRGKVWHVKEKKINSMPGYEEDLFFSLPGRNFVVMPGWPMAK